MYFSFSEETYTKKRAWGNSEISILKCVPELSLGRKPFLVGDRQCACSSLLLVGFFFPFSFFFPFFPLSFILSEALEKVFYQENIYL